MAPAPVSGTEGFAEQAHALLTHYESISPDHAHRAVKHLFPDKPAHILDIGAGTGRDAAWFAAKGHRVVAVEPTEALRTAAIALHPSPLIAWLDDSLPDLAVLRGRQERFDLVMLTAVWMHLDAEQRGAAMPNVTDSLAIGGTLIMTLRHGPMPSGRRMFEVSAQETIALARLQGLRVVLNEETESSGAHNRAAGVTWTVLAFGT